MFFFNNNKNKNNNTNDNTNTITTTEIELHQKDNSIIVELIKTNQSNNNKLYEAIRDLSSKIDSNYLNQQKQLDIISSDMNEKFNNLLKQVIENKVKINILEEERNRKNEK